MDRDLFNDVEAEILTFWEARKSTIVNEKMEGFVFQSQVNALSCEDWSVVEDVIEVLSCDGDKSAMRNLIAEGVGNALRAKSGAAVGR